MTVPCTPEEINAAIKKHHAKFDQDMKNPVLFWQEMGIRYVRFQK